MEGWFALKIQTIFSSSWFQVKLIVRRAFMVSLRSVERMSAEFKILVHGGAGAIPSEKKEFYAQACLEAARTGYAVLERGGTSLDAVQAAVTVMENNENLNAGRGSVLTSEKTVEMDAFIMDGVTMNAGGVAAVSGVKNPIHLARLVMEKTPHVLLIGEGAESFAREHNVEFAPQEYFITERSMERFAKWLERQGTVELSESDHETGKDKYGTVGAVAIDSHGNLAAATSTGGVTGKMPGRVGDTPVIGTGTYASKHIAVSATGIGEYIMRVTLSTRIEHYYLVHHDLNQAITLALQDMKTLVNGEAGVIVMGRKGEMIPAHTTRDMAWAWKTSQGEKTFVE